MGLLDILNTIQNNIHRETDGARRPPGGGMASDPRARTAPGAAPGGQGSPMAKALLSLLAVYAKKNMQRSGSAPPKSGGTIAAGNRGGGLGGALGGGGSGGGTAARLAGWAIC